MLIQGKSIVRRWQGFTLVEMMIVIVILAILMAIGVPSFQAFIQKEKIRTAAENMQAGLALARSEALRRNTNVSVWIVSNITGSCVRSNTGNSWVVSLADPAGACANDSSETTSPRIIQTRAGNDGSSGVNINVLSGDASPIAASCITFNGFGRAEVNCFGGDTSLARITFIAASPSNGRTLEVRVDGGGGARLCDPSKTGPAGC